MIPAPERRTHFRCEKNTALTVANDRWRPAANVTARGQQVVAADDMSRGKRRARVVDDMVHEVHVVARLVQRDSLPHRDSWTSDSCNNETSSEAWTFLAGRLHSNQNRQHRLVFLN